MSSIVFVMEKLDDKIRKRGENSQGKKVGDRAVGKAVGGCIEVSKRARANGE